MLVDLEVFYLGHLKNFYTKIFYTKSHLRVFTVTTAFTKYI